MAHFLAELYSAKPSWHALDPDGRQAFFARIGEGMDALWAAGVEPLTLGSVNREAIKAPDYDFFALWRCKDQTALDFLLDAIAASGWHDYFETINAGGEGTDMDLHLAQLAAA